MSYQMSSHEISQFCLECALRLANTGLSAQEQAKEVVEAAKVFRAFMSDGPEDQQGGA